MDAPILAALKAAYSTRALFEKEIFKI